MTTPLWLWQQADWPDFTWQDAPVQPKLRSIHHRLGQLSGKASLVDSDHRFSLDALLANIVASSAIESENWISTACVVHWRASGVLRLIAR